MMDCYKTNVNVVITADMPCSAKNQERRVLSATKFWFDLVELFRNGVKLDRHRDFLIKYYDDSFIATEAITWFHSELKNRYDADIQRDQVIMLLRKFYKTRVFTDVGKSSDSDSAGNYQVKETSFKDNKKLYRLLPAEENLYTRTEHNEKEVISKPQNYSVVIRELPTEEIFKIWEQAFIQRFVETVGYNVFSSFLKPGKIDGRRVLYNLTRFSNSGVTIAEKQEDNFPLWLMNAIHCLGRWPSGFAAQDANYPGFEMEVFNLIRDYFRVQYSSSPLLTFDLYDAFASVFIHASLVGNDKEFLNLKLNAGDMRQMFKLKAKLVFNETYPFNMSESSEDLLKDIFMPAEKRISSKFNDNQKSETLANASIQSTNPFKKIHHDTEIIEEVTDDVEPMKDLSCEMKKYSTSGTSSIMPNVFPKDEPLFLETAFTSERSPITRIISTTEIESSLGALRKDSLMRLSKPVTAISTTPPATDFVYENPLLQLSPADMINHPKYSNALRETNIITSTEPLSSLESSQSQHNADSSTDPEVTQQPIRTKSAINLSDENRDRCPYSPNSKKSGSNILAHYLVSPSKSVRKTIEMLNCSTTNKSVIMTPVGKEFAVSSFRLLSLLLPAKNRRHVHILLHMMEKIANNEKLVLDVACTKREIVISEFGRLIMNCQPSEEYDETLVSQIVNFLVDNHAEIFLQKDQVIKQYAENEIRRRQIEKIPTNSPSRENFAEDKENSQPKFFCRQISQEEYQEQSLLGSTGQSIRDLLGVIESMDDLKERKKRLKQFQKEYPHIYSEHFGNSVPVCLEMDGSSTEEAQVEKPKPKPFSRILRSLF